MLSNTPIFSTLLAGLLFTNAAYAASAGTPDYERETRIAEQIEPDIFDGEAVWLNDGGREFLGIHVAADDPKGAVLVLHGRDQNPEGANVTAPLRVGLAEAGWSTLAIQLPVLEKGKTYYDYLPILKFAHPRIEAALRYLREQGENSAEKPIILAAHSCGIHMANDWLNQLLDADAAIPIDGLVAIGLGATDYGQDLKTPFPIARLRIPVLDIYGENEFPRPLAMVQERGQMLEENGHKDSRQVSVPDANHYFHDQGETLTEAVAQWLANRSAP